uniref:OmpA family protein n=1 Tax=Parasphingopyxis algicola TaxID=2026624 RepID=UPI0015A09339|nr:OmpA family protein [Parasphingopyxis algicola]QLC25503.1 OmpA family protein [Parasphingopyxis algicola]
MPAQAKLLIGLLAVGLLTWLWLEPFGQAEAIADELENRAAEALAARGGDTVRIAVSRNPVRRTIELEGALPNSERAEIRETVAALPGVADATWTQPDAAEIDAAETAEASAAEACRAELNAVIASHRIQFRSGSPYINPPSQRMLDRLAEAARDCSGIRIEIAGHSSGSGRTNVNMEMSAFRATTVRDALVERGVPADMLTTIGKGASEPLGGDPADPANRRIEFSVSVVDGGAG